MEIKFVWVSYQLCWTHTNLTFGGNVEFKFVWVPYQLCGPTPISLSVEMVSSNLYESHINYVGPTSKYIYMGAEQEEKINSTHNTEQIERFLRRKRVYTIKRERSLKFILSKYECNCYLLSYCNSHSNSEILL